MMNDRKKDIIKDVENFIKNGGKWWVKWKQLRNG
jgi:hypothetical protein